LAGPVTRFTVARTTMRDAGPPAGVMAGLPWIRGLSEVWHSKIEKPKFKLGQLFEFMTKWHTLSHGIRMGMHVKTIKDQPIPHICIRE